MVVIFGFGRGKQEDLGEIAPGMCPNCHNQVYLHHFRSKKSVRLYFVPVVPYGTDNARLDTGTLGSCGERPRLLAALHRGVLRRRQDDQGRLGGLSVKGRSGSTTLT